MRRHPGVIAGAAAMVTLASALTACGGGDDSEAPDGDTRPTTPAALPPEFLECLADEGFDVEPDDVHSVPPQVLQTCFGSLHVAGRPDRGTMGGQMSNPIVVMIRFDGDPGDLIDRFERARRRWIDAKSDDTSPPVFYAACTLRQHLRGGPRAHQTGTGIVVVTAWATEADHKAFTHRMQPHLDAVGLGMPDRLEHLPIEKLGWD